MILKFIDTDRKKFKLFLLFTFAISLYHIIFLSTSPMPWYDEVWFASTTDTLLRTGKFFVDISPLQRGNTESLMHGPVYFLLTAINFKLFGIGIFQFRSVNLLFGLFSFFLMYKICSKEFNNRYSLIFMVMSLIMLDNMISVNLHSGRMEFIAVFFLLSSIFLFLYYPATNFNSLLVGSLAALAVLTTPRCGVLLLSMALIEIFYSKFTSRWFIKNLIIILSFVTLYSIWVFYAFGSIEGLIQYYANSSMNDGAESTSLLAFIGGNFFIPIYQYPLLLVFISVHIYSYIKFKRIIYSRFHILSVINILCFYLLVNDTGAYSVYIIPYIYISIFIVLDKIDIKKLVQFIYITFLFISISIFLMRFLTLIALEDARNYVNIDRFVEENIIPGSKVIGNDIFFYSVRKAGSDFQSMERGGSEAERIKYHIENYNFDYFIIGSDLYTANPGLIEAYKTQGSLKVIGNFKTNSSSVGHIILNLSKKILGQNLNSGYDCILFSRRK